MASASLPPGTISIPLSPNAAKAFGAMSKEQREALQSAVKIQIERAICSTNEDLFRLMDEMGREAQGKGLTQEILDDILNEP